MGRQKGSSQAKYAHVIVGSRTGVTSGKLSYPTLEMQGMHTRFHGCAALSCATLWRPEELWAAVAVFLLGLLAHEYPCPLALAILGKLRVPTGSSSSPINELPLIGFPSSPVNKLLSQASVGRRP